MPKIEIYFLADQRLPIDWSKLYFNDQFEGICLGWGGGLGHNFEMESGIPWNRMELCGMELYGIDQIVIIFPYGNSMQIVVTSISISISFHFQNQALISLFTIMSPFHFYSIPFLFH